VLACGMLSASDWGFGLMPSDWRTFFPLLKTSVRGGGGERGARRSLRGIGEVVGGFVFGWVRGSGRLLMGGRVVGCV